MTERYSADVSARGGEVQVRINDSGEGAQKSGHVALYYDGPEAFGDLPELVENRRVVAIPWATSAANVHNGTVLEFNAPEEYIDGDGRWLVFFGAEDDPLVDVPAHVARQEE